MFSNDSPAVLKRRSEGTKRTELYPAEISGTGTILAGTGYRVHP